MIQHTAPAQFLGYEYQSLQALLLILPTGSNSKVYVERFDDVSFESGDDIKQIIQTKFSLNDDAQITSKEPAFWRSIFNWIGLIEEGHVTSGEYDFLLMTTRSSDDPIILSLTKDSQKRDNRQILNDLIELATKIKNDNRDNKKTIKKFLSLSRDKKISLIEKIQILTGQSNVLNIQKKINAHLQDHSHSEFYESLFNHVYGWWYRQIIHRLSNDVNEPLSHKELMDEINYQRDQQSAKSLPIYFEKIKNPEKIIEIYSKFKFVKQLHLINLEKSDITTSIVDYYRAAEHRSRWTREIKPISSRLDDYDNVLKEKWRSEFRSLQREIQEKNTTNENELEQYGMRLFEWMDKYGFFPEIELEKNIAKMWLWKGSFHMLSDKCKVGWHPNFRTLLECKNDTKS